MFCYWQVVIEATVGDGYLGDISIDDISIKMGKCAGERSPVYLFYIYIVFRSSSVLVKF